VKEGGENKIRVVHYKVEFIVNRKKIIELVIFILCYYISVKINCKLHMFRVLYINSDFRTQI